MRRWLAALDLESSSLTAQIAHDVSTTAKGMFEHGLLLQHFWSD